MSESGGLCTSSLQGLDVCAVSDALDRLSLKGSLGGFRRWGPRHGFSGRVITVALAPGPSPTQSSHLGTRALSMASPGDVVVVANHGRTEAACWGGLLTLEACRRGIDGIILDGSLRDVDEVDSLGIPVLGRRATPRTARGRFHEVATNTRIMIEGIAVEPGDWVIADGSGVAFVADRWLSQVVDVARAIAAKEDRLADTLRKGAHGVQVLDDGYEQMLRTFADPPSDR